MKITRTKNLILRIISLSLLIFISESAIASAATPLYRYKLINGVTNRYYTISNATNAYPSSTKAAIYDWNNSTGSPSTYTPIWFIKTTSYSKSVVDFFGKNAGPTNYNAYTNFYTITSGQTHPDSKNWNYCNIYFNNFWLDPESSIFIKGVAAHEFGHSIGLAHYNTNRYSIMCTDSSGRKVTRAQKCDLDAVNIKY